MNEIDRWTDQRDNVQHLIEAIFILVISVAAVLIWTLILVSDKHQMCARHGLRCDGSEMQSIEHTYNTAGHER
jgi:hypothetical protein